jgi:glycerol-3-phosphate acyltransferase PlsX
VKGAVLAINAHPVKLILVGDEVQIRAELKKQDYPRKSIIIHHSSEAIDMEESPKKAIESKPDASILKAAKLVSSGEADALVSAGSTGSVVLAAAKYIPRIYGVRRTAIATVYPTLNELERDDYLCLMLDVGANVLCNAEELAQFALMGSAYVGDIRGIDNPKVALLNIGEEETKGTDKVRETYRILKNLPNLNFVGNIEGKDIPRGIVDVIVTEGFVGNIVIKTLEGAAKTIMHLGKIAYKSRLIWKFGLLLLSKGIKTIKEITDYSEYGGAPLLGFEKMIIVAHGRSNAKAISNAIKVAGKCVRDDVCGQIAKRIKDFETDTRREFEHVSEELS